MGQFAFLADGHARATLWGNRPTPACALSRRFPAKWPDREQQACGTRDCLEVT
jgi:hypothetical protein